LEVLSTPSAAKEYDAFGNIIPGSATGTWIGRFTDQGQSWLEITSSDASKRLLYRRSMQDTVLSEDFWSLDAYIRLEISTSRTRTRGFIPGSKTERKVPAPYPWHS